jgi:signal transduction histidine kinase
VSSLNSLFLILIIGGIAFILGGGAVYLFWLQRDRFFPSDKNALKKGAQRLDTDLLREISSMLTTLTMTLNYNRVLELAIDMGVQALKSPGERTDRVVSAVLLFSSGLEEADHLYIGVSRTISAADLHQTYSGKEGLLRDVIDEGDAILAKDLSKDPELGKTIAFQGCSSGYCIPLRHGIDTYGVILFAHPNENFFDTSRQEILKIIVKQAVVSIQNARLYQDLELEKERMMEIQEEARKKLARDLHDGPTQSVSAIAMRINFARRLMERDQKASSEELNKIEDLARRTTTEIRHMLFTLRPLVLESKGLAAAVQSMAEKMKETYDQDVLLKISPEVVSKLEMEKQGVIFYIIEEAVTNARKHAEAAHIWVRLRPIQNELALLEIKDDGLGFDVNSVTASYEHRGSLGMINLRERTELVNGVLKIDSAPGAGTNIQVAIPLTEEAVDRIRHSV